MGFSCTLLCTQVTGTTPVREEQNLHRRAQPVSHAERRLSVSVTAGPAPRDRQHTPLTLPYIHTAWIPYFPCVRRGVFYWLSRLT